MTGNGAGAFGGCCPRALLWAAVALLAFDAWVLFSPATQIIFWPDSTAYLTPAADALDGGSFSHVGGRGFVYPGMLWMLLSATREPWVIVAAQRVVALATAVVLAVVMIAVACRAGTTRHARIVAMVAASFWLTVYVLYPPAAGLAHAIAPEALAGWLLAVAMGAGVLLAFSSRAGAAMALVVSAVIASSVLSLVRPHWQLAAIVVPLGLPLVAPRAHRRRAALAAGGAVAVSLALLVAPEVHLQRRDDAYMSRVFGPRVLFCSSGDVVHDYLSTRSGDALSENVARSLARLLTAEARANARDWAVIGFNSDDCVFGETAALIAGHFAGDGGEEAAYYVRTYLVAIARSPAYLPERLGRGLASVAARPFVAVATDYWVRHDDRALAAARDLRPLFREWYDRHRAQFSGTIELETRRWLTGARLFFAGAGVLLVAGSVLSVLRIVVPSLRPGDDALSRAFAITLVAALATNLLIGAVHVFEPRYVAMQAPMFVLLGFCATLLSLSEISALRPGRLR